MLAAGQVDRGDSTLTYSLEEEIVVEDLTI
jgi:hypothetical protein